jgi:hypothetical protein
VRDVRHNLVEPLEDGLEVGVVVDRPIHQSSALTLLKVFKELYVSKLKAGFFPGPLS